MYIAFLSLYAQNKLALHVLKIRESCGILPLKWRCIFWSQRYLYQSIPLYLSTVLTFLLPPSWGMGLSQVLRYRLTTVSVYSVHSTDLSPVSPVGREVVSGPRCSSFCRVLLQPTTRKEYGIDYWQPSSQVDVCVVCAAMFTCGERMCVCVCVCLYVCVWNTYSTCEDVVAIKRAP